MTSRIAEIETALTGSSSGEVELLLAEQKVRPTLLESALEIKALSGQINVLIHVAGILASLPYILTKREKIESLSLGAGNTGRAHELVTNIRIAEFKFIEWRGGAETIRQNSVFQDIFNLASAETGKKRQLYVLGTEHPLRFLGNKRALSSVLSKNAAMAKRFHDLHGEKFRTVGEYWKTVEESVEVIDLRMLVPELSLT